MKHTPFHILIIALIVFPLVGCNKPVANQLTANLGSGSTQVWFDFPLDGSKMPMGTYDLVSHSADNGGISQVEWSINGSVVASEPVGQAANTIENLSEFHHSWTPAEPGEYVLNVRAQSVSGNWTMPAEAAVTILGEITVTPSPTVTATALTLTPSLTPTETSTPTVTPTTDGQLALVDAAKSGAQFSHGSCSPNSLTFTIRATQPKNVTYMYLFYKLQDKGSGEQTASNGGAAMTKSGADTWTLTVKGSDISDNNRFDESWFLYQFIAQGGTDVVARSKQLSDVTFTACGSAPPAGGITPALPVPPDPITPTPMMINPWT